MVNGKGGELGPELSRVGAARSAAYLIDSIREPSKELSEGMVDPNNRYANALVYDTVTVVTRIGETIDRHRQKRGHLLDSAARYRPTSPLTAQREPRIGYPRSHIADAGVYRRHAERCGI